MGKQWKQWETFFLGSIITADGDCSHEIKRHLPLERWVNDKPRQSYDKPRQHIKKQRHHFADKGPYSQSYGFSRCESWTIKKAESWIIEAFERWCSRRLFFPLHFLCFQLIYFNWRIITLQYCDGFCHTSIWTGTSIHVFPSFYPPPPPSSPHLSRLSHSTGFTLLHALNLPWSSISRMAMYMFQCYSLISFHPRLLPLSPKVCSLHLCLLCCPACRIVGTIFLNSIYMR